MGASYDVVIVGGGHNGLVAAAYLARAGRSVLLLEQQDRLGGAAVSERVFDGIDARLSRYSYLVSLLPERIVRDLDLNFATRRRRISSYTPVDGTSLLVDTARPDRTRDAFEALTGSAAEYRAWERFYAMTTRMAQQVFPTLTEPLPTRAELQRRIDDRVAWETVFERPIGETLEAEFGHDAVRGIVLTDALIGTFAGAHDPALRQNRCLLYHVIGRGTGEWDVPIGGMGALTGALADAARAAGAKLVTGANVTAVRADGRTAEVTWTGGTGGSRAPDTAAETSAGARYVLANVAPYTLASLLGTAAPPKPQGAQLKINMLVDRLPRLLDGTDPRDAFAGTFHIAEGYGALERAYLEAAAGRLPAAPPSEIYCHTLTDRSILGPGPAAAGMHTLTLFGLHTPPALFANDPERSTATLVESTLDCLDAVLAESIRDRLVTDADGKPCLEARNPLDLEREIGLPGGHIFHGDLAFPYLATNADATDPAVRWGVATEVPNVLLCGAGAVRGGGVSGIGGHNAAMAVLSR
ncbi:phytoene desaturase family protein [Nocardia stercoris]|uniref:NAD(P)/FAD-dependent oxidoreductase n=1 Tax=Nocardia stercoris TaxID=2483361 RepID=A0A3M2L8L6_9NOCA|nr:NAD(P)/FAD-dependent oxidoreductase [Nocardia stercoris]RMI34022.1 NAD(P)/FAD-dependent oxidoreductase [Nocardia stercoris]